MKTNAKCPDCGQVFASRKARHTHQMQAHRGERKLRKRGSAKSRRPKHRYANPNHPRFQQAA
jgi:uncharacterized C2H2 Zn-finger protein